jgi:hypothetical protein
MSHGGFGLSGIRNTCPAVYPDGLFLGLVSLYMRILRQYSTTDQESPSGLNKAHLRLAIDVVWPLRLRRH